MAQPSLDELVQRYASEGIRWSDDGKGQFCGLCQVHIPQAIHPTNLMNHVNGGPHRHMLVNGTRRQPPPATTRPPPHMYHSPVSSAIAMSAVPAIAMSAVAASAVLPSAPAAPRIYCHFILNAGELDDEAKIIGPFRTHTLGAFEADMQRALHTEVPHLVPQLPFRYALEGVSARLTMRTDNDLLQAIAGSSKYLELYVTVLQASVDVPPPYKAGGVSSPAALQQQPAVVQQQPAALPQQPISNFSKRPAWPSASTPECNHWSRSRGTWCVVGDKCRFVHRHFDVNGNVQQVDRNGTPLPHDVRVLQSAFADGARCAPQDSASAGFRRAWSLTPTVSGDASRSSFSSRATPFFPVSAAATAAASSTSSPSAASSAALSAAVAMPVSQSARDAALKPMDASDPLYIFSLSRRVFWIRQECPTQEALFQFADWKRCNALPELSEFNESLLKRFQSISVVPDMFVPDNSFEPLVDRAMQIKLHNLNPQHVLALLRMCAYPAQLCCVAKSFPHLTPLSIVCWTAGYDRWTAYLCVPWVFQCSEPAILQANAEVVELAKAGPEAHARIKQLRALIHSAYRADYLWAMYQLVACMPPGGMDQLCLLSFLAEARQPASAQAAPQAAFVSGNRCTAPSEQQTRSWDQWCNRLAPPEQAAAAWRAPDS